MPLLVGNQRNNRDYILGELWNWVCNKLKGMGILDVQGIANCLIWQSKVGKEGSW